MGWLIIEGLDRAGKSSVAELYKSQGYEIVHMSAPDKKYRQPGYSGPSYLDDTLDLIMKYDGKDVVWDRSWYGEMVWPHVYGREPSLSEEDIEILQEFEERNQANRILMIDPDTAGHWKRCVDNKEPLNQGQFRLASTLYTKLAHKYNFVPQQLGDFSDKHKKPTAENDKQAGDSNPETSKDGSVDGQGQGGTPVNSSAAKNTSSISETISGIKKLEKANAISAVLSKRIIKQRGNAFDELEGEVTNFLKGRLEELLGGNKSKASTFADEEVQILKMFCQRLKEKESQSNQPVAGRKPTSAQPRR